MQVPLQLIVRLKSHFISLECGVDVILGINGYVWVQSRSLQAATSADDMMTDESPQAGASTASIYSSKNDHIDLDTRQAIDRVTACINVLASQSIVVSDTNISAAYDVSLSLRAKEGGEVSIPSLMEPRYADQIRSILLSNNY